MPDLLRIRRGAVDDVPRLTEIYNVYVRDTPVTFDIEPWSVERRRAEWFDHYADSGRHQMLVAEEGSDVVGYATSSVFRPKAAYETTVEATIYLAPDAKGRGIGRALYSELLDRLRKEDVRRVLAGITLPNPASKALHERLGFTQVAHFTEVGRKFDRYWDVIWLEKKMEES